MNTYRFSVSTFSASLFALGLLSFPGLTFAADIYVSPATGTYAVGSTFTVTLRMNTAGQAVNTGEITASYSTGTLELVGSAQGSTFSLAAPGSPRRGSGSVYFGGGIPSPGYTGSSGSLGTLTFRVKSAGTGTVSLSSGKALLNDGFGTDAFKQASGGTFTLVSSAAPTPFSAPQVSSPTHPNQNSWYATSSPVFTWTLPAGADMVSFEFDQKNNTVPDTSPDQSGGNATLYTEIEDGVWYFHIRARVGGVYGATTHYRAQIDTTPPEKFALGVSTDLAGIPTISFATTDALSGIHHYELAVDNLTIDKSATSSITISKITRGRHTLSVIAYDHAGNAEEAQAVVSVTKTFMISLNIIIWLIIFNIIITILLLIILWLEIQERRREGPISERVKRAKRDIDESLSRLRIQAQTRLSTMSDVPAKDIVSKEKILEDEMAGILLEAKSHIDKTINDLGEIPERGDESK